jgi:hypothetical protein
MSMNMPTSTLINMPKRSAGFAVAGLLLLGLAAPAAHAARTFCCTDEKNQQRCGDIVPEACRSRRYIEYNEAGVPVRKVAAPLTEAQQATKDAEDKKKRDLAEAGEKQRLADQALLSTYADEKDLDTARDRAVGEMERSVKSAEVNLVELNKTKASLAAEAAALKGQPQPFQLKRKIERNQMALTEQQATLEVKKKDMEETQAKFEGFRKRLKELKSTDTAVKPDSP